MKTKTERDLTEEEKDFGLEMAIMMKLWEEAIDDINNTEYGYRFREAFAKSEDVTTDSFYAKLFEIFTYGVNAGVGFANDLMKTPPVIEEEE